jgi:hypothetical protein
MGPCPHTIDFDRVATGETGEKLKSQAKIVKDRGQEAGIRYSSIVAPWRALRLSIAPLIHAVAPSMHTCAALPTSYMLKMSSDKTQQSQ